MTNNLVIDWSMVPVFTNTRGERMQFRVLGNIGIGRGGTARARMTGTGTHTHVIKVCATRHVDSGRVEFSRTFTKCGLKGLSVSEDARATVTCAKCAKALQG